MLGCTAGMAAVVAASRLENIGKPDEAPNPLSADRVVCHRRIGLPAWQDTATGPGRVNFDHVEALHLLPRPKVPWDHRLVEDFQLPKNSVAVYCTYLDYPIGLESCPFRLCTTRRALLYLKIKKKCLSCNKMLFQGFCIIFTVRLTLKKFPMEIFTRFDSNALILTFVVT